MRLSVAPTSDVIVELRPSDGRITLSDGHAACTGSTRRNWPTGVRVTVTAVDDFVRQDPHNTTIELVGRRPARPAAPARLDVLAYDDETAGVVTVETGSGTLVVAGDSRRPTATSCGSRAGPTARSRSR